VTRPILAWHWTAGRKLRNGRPVRVGRWVRHKGLLVLCESGLHASRRALDALGYAPGTCVWRVECDPEGMIEGNDKLVCRARRALWGVDATRLLRAFARRCVLDVAHLWSPVALRWLRHGREQHRAVAWAATAAARAATAKEEAAAWAAQERRLVRMIHAERRRMGVLP